MKKLVLKTALITFGAAVLLGVLILMILCFAAPKTMMDFTASMGMDGLSGNFAYSEYERSGDLECLARSYLVAVEEGEDEKALERWEKLYADEGFSAYCQSGAPSAEGLPAYSYRDYLVGSAARVKFRLAIDDAAKEQVLAFALGETAKSFPEGNPTIALAAEAISRQDKAFAGTLLARLKSSDFEQSEAFLRLLSALETA